MPQHTTTAVILAAGRGSRMQRRGPEHDRLPPTARQLAAGGLKGLIPIAGRPFLDHAAQRLIEAGITRIGFVVAPGAEAMRDYGRQLGRRTGLEIAWSVQHSPRGTAHAVLCAETIVDDDSFLLCNCDNLYPVDAITELLALPTPDCGVAGFDRDALIRHGNFSRERIRCFAALHIHADGRLIEIVEKPPDPDAYTYRGTVWAGMNLYRFTPAIFQACRQTEPHPVRGERELTDAVSWLLGRDAAGVRVIFSSGQVLDMTGPDDIASVEQALENRA